MKKYLKTLSLFSIILVLMLTIHPHQGFAKRLDEDGLVGSAFDADALEALDKSILLIL